MKSSTRALCAAASLAYACLSRAQSTLDPVWCISGSGVTAFPNCKYLSDTIDYCAGPSVSAGPAFVSCYCNQALFNSFFDCESEQRLCFGDTDNDGSFQTGIAQWHSVCDPRITAPPTTPVVSTITATFDRYWCASMAAACARGTAALSLCADSYGRTGTKYTSCMCLPEAISQDYTCEFLGNKSCLLTTADASNILLYGCSNAAAVLANIVANQTQSPTSPASRSASTTASLMTSTSALTSSGASSGVTAASPSPSATKSSTAAVVNIPNFLVSAAGVGVTLMWFL